MKILELTALELSEKIKAGEIKVKDAVKAALDRAKEAEPAINSYVTLDEEGAYAQAEEGEIAPDYSSFKIMGHAQSKLYDKKEIK